MDWYSVLSIFLVVLSIGGDASGAGSRKKIRIHIPQKIKHIHHHKKVVITQQHVGQPTSFLPQYASPEQYAAGYLTASDSAVEPALALLPIAEGRRSTPGSSPAPNLQPLYRARGHYGPPNEESYQKRVIKEVKSAPKIKIIKITEGKKKRIIRTKKPKRIIINTSLPTHEEKDSNPATSYHDEFYSDNKNTNYKTVRKPKRVEKYVDGDGEHIHTYSEEHIHQIVYDDPPPKPSDASGMHSSLPTAAVPSVIPIAVPNPSNSHVHAIDAIIGGMPTLGSLGSPTHMEYLHYDPSDVTYDHIIHDHGEIVQNLPPEIKIPRPPKASYNMQGIKINPNFNVKDVPSYDGKGSWVPPANYADLSYYENLFSKSKPKHNKRTKPKPSIKHTKIELPKKPSEYYKNYKDESQSSSDDSYSEVSHFASLYGSEQKKKQTSSYHGNLGSPSKPKGPKSLRQHHYHKAAENKPYSTAASLSDSIHYGSSYQHSKYRETKPTPNSNYKYHTNIYSDSDAFATNDERKKESDPLPPSWRNKKNKSKKSVSSQNINFGGQEHKMVINHETSIAIGAAEARAEDSYFQESSPKPATVSIAYSPYDSEANSAVADATNTNFRIVEAPIRVIEESAPTSRPIIVADNTNVTVATPLVTEPTQTQLKPKSNKKQKKKNGSEKRQKSKKNENTQQEQEPSKIETSGRGKFKYGDRLNERYDYEYDDVVFV